jgi:hypothetical protein
MTKNTKILSLLASGLISIVSATSMEEFKENITEKCNKDVQQGEDLTDHRAKIDINQLPVAKTEISVKRKMVGYTPLEQDIFDAIEAFSSKAEKINIIITYLKNEINSQSKS